MDITKLSSSYTVRKLVSEDVELIYELSEKNPLFYRYCPPFVSRESILNDMKALPPRTTYDDKFYIGFFQENKLVAVMDLIFHFPDMRTAFIGLFMMNQDVQGKGIGSAIIQECFDFLRRQQIHSVRLAFAKGNPQSEAFWAKNGFLKTGVEAEYENYTAVIMHREL